jgi:hypothetical protein
MSCSRHWKRRTPASTPCWSSKDSGRPADKAGRFEWRPKQLKLDILPFLPFDLAPHARRSSGRPGLIHAYEIDGKRYGFVPSLGEHQRFSGSEAKNPPTHPAPVEFLPLEALRKHLGSTRGSHCTASH